MRSSSSYILIVDDQVTNLKVLSTTLTEAGFEIAVATNGEMALQQIEIDPPELIILDILMPEMDGFETCQRLKNNPARRDIPVIFMTALADTIDKVRGFTLGAVDYITKPFEAEEVLARVNSHLQLRLLTQALEEKNQNLSDSLERLKKTQQKLIQQEKLATMGALTAGIAHELRNPLNFIKNYAEGSIELSEDLLEEVERNPVIDNEESVQYVNELVRDIRENSLSIARHTRRAESVIEDTLLQASDTGAAWKSVDLNALLDRALQLVYKSKYTGQKDFKVAICKEYDETIGQVMVIGSQMSRAFINIIDNAFHALQEKHRSSLEKRSPKAVVLTLSLITKRLDERTVQVRIRDSGTGISPEIRGQLFQPFFSTKPAHEGTGLGLYLTRDIIVNHHGGTLDIDTFSGEFTEFILDIPTRIESPPSPGRIVPAAIEEPTDTL